MRISKKIKENIVLRNIILFLSILGPGIITGSVDNDAGGITTYSVAGAQYGYTLLWVLIPSFVVLFIVQEMNARMGMVTGKGLADLIRENFGVKITFLIFIFLVLGDIGNTATEFAGIAGSLQIFGISKYVSVPLSAVVVWIFVAKGNYKIAERIFLVLSLFLLSYIISAVLAKPDWGGIGRALIKPKMEMTGDYFAMILGIIGTTIAPWMQFYMQSAVIEKRLKIKDYVYTMWDVLIGSIITVTVAFFIMIACASTLHANGIKIEVARDAAMALRPLAGTLASTVFAFGLFIASIFSATILPLATAFYVCEAFGFEAGIDKKINEAPQFYFLFTLIIVIGSIIILIPNAPLVPITIWSQVINAVLLPVVLIAMIILVNKEELMGEHKNKLFQNILGLVTIVVLVILNVILILYPVINIILTRG
jgi:NRAMP (natural resistance-associated macrophage protein)-like metal ion transporter